MMRRPLLPLILLLSVFNLSSDELKPSHDAVKEMRTHFKLTSEDGLSDFTCTDIERISDTLTSSRILLQDSAGGRFLISREREFEHQTSVREIREVGGTEFLRYTMFLPFSTKTRAATQAQAHAHPELLNDANTKFELSSVGNASISGTASFWKDPPTAREWRSRARLMLSPQFLDSLELMETAGVFRVPGFPDIDAIVMPLVLYRTECELKTHLVNTALPPDCAFDAKFGFNCSDEQKERAAKYKGELSPKAKPY